MIFNEKHKELFNDLKRFYLENTEIFRKLQDEVVKKGNDQTPINYWLQLHGVELNLDLPVAFNLTHLHRKEIWTVLHGAGKAKIGGEKKIILEGDTVTVPVGVVHKLSNPGKTKLIILESQMGSYCEEDDIVRLEEKKELDNSVEL